MRIFFDCELISSKMRIYELRCRAKSEKPSITFWQLVGGH